MKIRLNAEVIADIEPRRGYLGCHLIMCENNKEAPCNVGRCVIEDRGLDGGFYPLEEVEDLLIKE